MVVAVICAANPYSGGMYSVDLGAHSFFSKRKIPFRMFVAQAGSKTPRELGALKFDLLQTSDQLSDFSHVVYWGDFLNNPVYGARDFSQRDVQHRIVKTREEGFARWMSIFAPESVPKGQRLISVGGNFQHNVRENQMSAPRLMKAYDNIQKNFVRLLPRDSFSVASLANHFDYENLSKIVPGIDCAFLCPSENPAQPTAHFSYLFGRSGYTDHKALVSRVERETGLAGVKLSKWLKLPADDFANAFEDRRSKMATAQFVLTDVYHVAINAMNLGVPVFGFGRPANVQEGTLGDMKKRYLFDMMGLRNYYFETDTVDEFNTSRLGDYVSLADGFRSKRAIASALIARFEDDIEASLAI